MSQDHQIRSLEGTFKNHLLQHPTHSSTNFKVIPKFKCRSCCSRLYQVDFECIQRYNIFLATGSNVWLFLMWFFFLLISLMLVFAIVSFCIFGIIERAKAEEISSTVILGQLWQNYCLSRSSFRKPENARTRIPEYQRMPLIAVYLLRILRIGLNVLNNGKWKVLISGSWQTRIVAYIQDSLSLGQGTWKCKQ